MGAHQQRIQPGVPTGGQFAVTVHKESLLSLVEPGIAEPLPLSALAAADQEELDEVIPQANRPETVMAVVDAVADGCISAADIASAIGMSSRQGAYYPDAARSLGLVEKFGSGPVEYALTERGAQFVHMDGPDRAKAMVQMLDDNTHVQTYLLEGRQSLADEWETNSWERQLSDTTIERRLATIKTWSEFYLAGRAEQTELMESAMAGTKQRAPVIREARRLANKPKVVRRCPSCNMALPSGSDVCDLCG
jgi:hypothetical protein